MFWLIKKIIIELLTVVVNGFNHTKYVLLRNQKCMIQSNLINLYPNEYGQKFQYYPSAVELDRYHESCNTLNDLSNKVCILNETKYKRISTKTKKFY